VLSFNLPKPVFKFQLPNFKTILAIFFILAVSAIALFYSRQKYTKEVNKLKNSLFESQNKLDQVLSDFESLKNEDQVQKNLKLEEEIKNIYINYNQIVSSYENILKLKEKTNNTQEIENLYTLALVQLSKRDYDSAKNTINNLNKKISDEEEKIAEAFIKIPENVPSSNNAPSSGYTRQNVTTDIGNFMVSIVAADLGTTKVIVDTASASNCPNNCPVLPLSEYISRNNAFAGINGSYFCPATYPSCAGKENTYDTLLMNKDKTYFNSDNNVYSTNPAVIFGNGWIRFVSQTLEWGRDTSIDSMISNYPMLVQGGNIAFTGSSDPKQESKGSRSFVANKGNTVYIGVVHNASVTESAHVMKALGMENALNLDDGGSTALWYGGYKVGPGRNIPNAILFVRR
jgi:hypothetical protein